VIHGDRARAGSFGEDAALYDATRPRYPDAMFDDLVNGTERVVDAGCGTGIATEAFAARGCDVLGVEPDPRMAEVARAKGLAVEVATFEEWDARGRAFDLVASAQAWHWVDPVAGPLKAAAVLRPGGRFAAFWNLGAHDPETHAVLDVAYERHAPALLKDSVALGNLGRPGDVEALRESGAFEEIEERRYPWTRTYTTAEWVEVLPTHSDHRLLPEPVRAALLGDVAVAIDSLGGSIEMAYETFVVTGVRRARG